MSATTFDHSIAIHLHGKTIDVRSAEQAAEILADVDWPGERGALHRDAYETCLKVMDGHRSAVDAERRFAEAAREAGVLGD